MNPANIYKSIFFEISAISSLLLARNFSGAVAFFILHSIASFLISQVIVTVIPSRYRRNPNLILYFMTLFNTATLSLGYAASFYMSIVVLRKQKFQEKYDISSINVSQLAMFPSVKRQLGEAVASVDLSHLPKETKMKIISTFSDDIRPDAVKTIKRLLSDRDDEIRLYSFQMLNSIKSSISEKINNALSDLEKEKDEYNKAMIEKALALYYSNMFNLEIADEALMHFFMDKSMFYLSNAEKILSDGETCFLRGQILFLKKEYDAALENFERALRYKVNESAVYTFISEIYYIKKDYARVRETLKRDVSLKLDFHTMPVVLIWEGDFACN